MAHAVKKRRPVVAAILSILTAGVGQLYNGSPKRAAAFFAVAFAFYVLLNAMMSSAALLSSVTLAAAGVVLAAGFIFYFFNVIDAFRGARKAGRLELRRFQRWYIYLLVIVFGAALRTAIEFTPIGAGLHRTPAGSMAPTLAPGDYFAASSHAYRTSAPVRGDVVIFALPDGSGITYVKRVIGLPGDRIRIRSGILYINDVPVARELADDHPQSASWRRVSGELNKVYVEILPEGLRHPIIEVTDAGLADNTTEFLVPMGSYFVMGDNRDNSADSRFRHIGFIPQENLRGQVTYVFWARDWSRLGAVAR